jgi:hypothetical protein
MSSFLKTFLVAYYSTVPMSMCFMGLFFGVVNFLLFLDKLIDLKKMFLLLIPSIYLIVLFLR